MSKLETKVIPFLYELIDGKRKPSVLNKGEQLALSSWSFKTAAALCSSTKAPQNKIPAKHIKNFYYNNGTSLPENVAVISSSAINSDFLWAFSPTWAINTIKNMTEIELQLIQKKSYKIFMQLGNLMLAVCWLPPKTVQYKVESWAGIELVGASCSYTKDEDCRKFFEHESEAFLMAISAEIYN
ncbi:MAG: hypothetical protein HWD86_01370 [Kangiellaceae bacterium]|nr:hypothetical protein [Kangiellaceae bacterium]